MKEVKTRAIVVSRTQESSHGGKPFEVTGFLSLAKIDSGTTLLTHGVVARANEAGSIALSDQTLRALGEMIAEWFGEED